MAKRSLFSILSEQPWWVSLVVAAALFAIAYQFLPQFAPFVALPVRRRRGLCRLETISRQIAGRCRGTPRRAARNAMG